MSEKLDRERARSMASGEPYWNNADISAGKWLVSLYDRIDALETENAALRAERDALKAELEAATALEPHETF